MRIEHNEYCVNVFTTKLAPIRDYNGDVRFCMQKLQLKVATLSNDWLSIAYLLVNDYMNKKECHDVIVNVDEQELDFYKVYEGTQNYIATINKNYIIPVSEILKVYYKMYTGVTS